MKRIKKILASLMVVVMILTAAPLSGFVGMELNLDWLSFDWLDFNTKASAASYSGTCGESLTWSLDTETGELIISGMGAMYDYSYSPWYDYRSSIENITIGNSVTSIGYCAFVGCSGVTSVTIPGSVTSIGDYAFEGCIGLTSVTIPDSVISIGENTFYGCTSLTSVAIPDSITSIDYGTFFDCTSLTNIIIPNGVTSIGCAAFGWCESLISITLPNSITSIDVSAFYECTSLETVYYSGTQEQWNTIEIDSNNESLINAEIIFLVKDDGVVGSGECGDNLSWLLNAETGELIISGEGKMTHYSSTSSAPWNEYSEDIKQIVIYDGVTSIGNSAFVGCKNLTSVSIPDSVTKIGNTAFRDCVSLASISIPNTVTTIEYYTFYGCTALTTVKIPDGVTTIRNYAFGQCTSLKTVIIPASVTNIVKNAFYECTSLVKVMFMGTSEQWSAVTIGERNEAVTDNIAIVLDFGNYDTDLFWYITDNYNLHITGSGKMSELSHSSYAPWNEYLSSIKMVTIDEVITKIGSSAFNGCESLISIIIPDSVTSIGSYAFYGCTELASITIPDSVTSIDHTAFSYCTKLTSVTIPDSVTSIGFSIFDGCIGLANVTIGNGVTSISDFAFEGCTGLVSVTFGDSVTSIGSYAFSGCTGLTSVTIPDSVTSIGSYAFRGCDSLTSITIPSNVISIDSSAFYDVCDDCIFYVEKDSYAETYAQNKKILYYYLFNGSEEKIVSVTVTSKLSFEVNKETYTMTINCDGSMLSFVNEDAPWSQYKLYVKNIVINDNCTSIGAYAFKDFIGLKSVIIPESVENIGSSAFSGCTNLANIIIPDSVTSIGSAVFYGCSGLISVTIGNNVTSISSLAFSGCTGLANITIPDSVISIGDSAFYNCDNLTDVTISKSVTTIGGDAFRDCDNLENVIIPDSVISVGSWAFRECYNLRNITMPVSVQTGMNSFLYCSNITKITLTKGNGRTHNYLSNNTPWYESRERIAEVVIEDGVTGIGDYMFYGCTKLGDITLPLSVQSIGDKAFAGCQGLEKLKVYNRSCTFGTDCTSYYTTIVGYAGSTAEAYANEMGFNFELIPDDDHEHIYSNSCDNECNICGYVNPDAGHTYDNDCDTECNYCDFVRTPNHTDDNNDGLCDVCEKALSDILIGVEQNFKVKVGETVYIKFVPANSGVYTFYSSSSADTYGYIFNADKNTLASDDDSGGNRQFSITYTFKSGTVYYLGVKYYSSSASGEIPVTIRLDRLICDHNHTHEEHQDSTCTENGYDKVICDDCGEIVSTTSLPLLDHDYKTITAPPTCVDEGTVVCLCKVCRDAYISEILDPLGHSELVWVTVKVPSTRNEGIMNQVCPACGEVFDTKTVPAISLSADSTANIDFETNTISGFNSGSFSIGDYLSATNNGYTFTCESEKIATGTVITLTAGEDTINEFAAVIFGDTNGDSWYDGQDAIIVDCLANGMLTKEDVGEAVYMAADCNHDGVIDQLDVALLNQAGTLLANVDQSKPAEVLLETSSAYVEYLDLIDQSPELEIEDETDTPESDVETDDTTPEQDAKVDIFEMILNFIKSIFEMLFAYIPMPIK